MNFEEINKEFAQFLGWYKPDSRCNDPRGRLDVPDELMTLSIENDWGDLIDFYMPILKFHESMDWMMLVLDKIEKDYDYMWTMQCEGIECYGFILHQYFIFHSDVDNLDLPEGLYVCSDGRATSFKDPKIDAIYQGCYTFLTWLKQQEENDPV